MEAVLGNLAAVDTLVASKVKVLKCGEGVGTDGIMVVADGTKGSLLRVQAKKLDLMKVKTGQSV